MVRSPLSDLLPLDQHWPKIRSALESSLNLVLVAEPGAGKTTRLPPLLMKSGLIPAGKKILMLEPRRLAARAACSRIAEENLWTIGREVGYQVRFENQTSGETKLIILTEGLLTRRLQSDPTLKDVGCVILDEFHERSQHTDLALALLFELQSLERPDLRLIVMSATLDADPLSLYLGGCPIVRVPGRTFPVEIVHGRKPLSLDAGPGFIESMTETILHALDLSDSPEQRRGSLLAFLPGTREIRGVRENLLRRPGRKIFEIHELHGRLSLDDQARVLRNSSGASKVILATNIAETSVTIDGVHTVVDSGLARVVRTDECGFERVVLSRISLASATQRAGRSGRQGPGICYRLWSQIDEAAMPPFELPEIQRIDLTDAMMNLLAHGINDPMGFSWFERPLGRSLKDALLVLEDLGFREPQTGRLTEIGREAMKFPLPARPARLVIEALKYDRLRLGARLAALLSERDIVTSAFDLKRTAALESDLLLRLHILESGRDGGDFGSVSGGVSGGASGSAGANIRRVADAIESAGRRVDRAHVGKALPSWSELSDDDLALRLLLAAFPDRICRRRRPREPAARMVGGRGVTLARQSVVESAEFFLALATMEQPRSFVSASASNDALISLASKIERDWIEVLFPKALGQKSELVFDEGSESVQKQTRKLFRDLPLGEAHRDKPNSEEAHGLMIQVVRARWTILSERNEDLSKIFSRLKFLKENFPGEAWGEISDDEVLPPVLDELVFGKLKLSEVAAQALDEIYLRHLPDWTRRLLSSEAPEALTVPSGSRIRIHYPQGRAPYLEVRIQEIFGLRESPRLARGAVAIVFHLLGPNYRPVQVTSDLKSFWQTGYGEVRKELKSRYPKHSWPEDPLTGIPEAKGRRRQPN